MATDSIITNSGKIVLLRRGYTSEADLTGSLYLEPTKFKVGIVNTTPLVTDTNLDIPIPILDGTVNDTAEDQLAGTSGGDNSTDNTSTFKEGAGQTDVTSQNLIANNTNVSKIWTLNPLDSNITKTKPFGHWLYIKDATALAKFKSSSTALEVRFRTNGDGATLFFSKTFTASTLAVGWNWITSNATAVEDLTPGGGGDASGNIDEFVIIITTNNSTDTFTTGDVLFDLLRTWATTDLIKSYVAGFPSFDNTNKEVTIRCFLSSVDANGFDISGLGLFNEDTSVLMTDESTFTAESKSSTDEFAFVVKNRIL